MEGLSTPAVVAVVATGARSIVEVTQPNHVVTAAEMDSMSPQERADAIEAGRARSWDDVPEPFRTGSFARLRNWERSSGPVAERQVRFTDEFFSRLDLLLDEKRDPDGKPSRTDFLVFEIPRQAGRRLRSGDTRDRRPACAGPCRWREAGRRRRRVRHPRTGRGSARVLARHRHVTRTQGIISSGSGDSRINPTDVSSPNGIRTRAATLRGWCPRPLDDGAE